jgi:hypothetical protein
MITYHADGNLILQQPFKTKSDAHRLAAYNTIMTRLAAKGSFPRTCIDAIEQNARYGLSKIISSPSWLA